MNCALNCLLITKDQPRTELIRTWHQSNRTVASQVLSQQFIMQDQGSEALRFAFDTMYLGHERMLDRLATIRAAGDDATKLFAQLSQLFQHDQWI